MKKLLEKVKNKLENQFSGINPAFSIIPQLMLAVLNEETKGNLDLNMYDRFEMEEGVLSLLNYSDKAVWLMLGLNNKEHEKDITRLLSEAETTDQIREVMIIEILFEPMRENIEDFPYHRREGGII